MKDNDRSLPPVDVVNSESVGTGRRLLSAVRPLVAANCLTDWRAPLQPFIDAVDQHRTLPQGILDRPVTERLLRHTTKSRRAKIAVVSCETPPIFDLIGQAAFQAGTSSLIVSAVDTPSQQPSGCLSWWLYGASRGRPANKWWKAYSEFNRFLGVVSQTYAAGAFGKVLNLDFDLSRSLLPTREGMYWRKEFLASQFAGYLATLPLGLALEGYLLAVISGHRAQARLMADWLHVFVSALPFGRLKNRPDTWLFLVP